MTLFEQEHEKQRRRKIKCVEIKCFMREQREQSTFEVYKLNLWVLSCFTITLIELFHENKLKYISIYVSEYVFIVQSVSSLWLKRCFQNTSTVALNNPSGPVHLLSLDFSLDS